jgi:hypothetical protein
MGRMKESGDKATAAASNEDDISEDMLTAGVLEEPWVLGAEMPAAAAAAARFSAEAPAPEPDPNFQATVDQGADVFAKQLEEERDPARRFP